MRNDWGRRVFLAVLCAALASLVWLCLEGKTLMGLNAEALHGRRNKTLYLEQRADGITYIGGSGVLYSEDMLSLVESEGNKNDVTDLVIGDGITEIAYNALYRFEGLVSLRLGRDVQYVDNGAVKWCTSLKYVFLPGTIRRVSRDFLYLNANCLVFTDGAEGDLPKLRNVKKDRICYGVDSYDALTSALGGAEGLPKALRHWWP